MHYWSKSRIRTRLDHFNNIFTNTGSKYFVEFWIGVLHSHYHQFLCTITTPTDTKWHNAFAAAAATTATTGVIRPATSSISPPGELPASISTWPAPQNDWPLAAVSVSSSPPTATRCGHPRRPRVGPSGDCAPLPRPARWRSTTWTRACAAPTAATSRASSSARRRWRPTSSRWWPASRSAGSTRRRRPARWARRAASARRRCRDRTRPARCAPPSSWARRAPPSCTPDPSTWWRSPSVRTAV